MKYEMTVFASVKARLTQQIEAESQEEACRKLLKEITESGGSVDLHSIYDKKTATTEAAWVELDEDNLALLVDVVGDEDFANSNWYGFNGDEPVKLEPGMPLYDLTTYLRQQKRISELKDALSQLLDRLDFHGSIDLVREEGPIQDARDALEKAQRGGGE